MGVVMRDAESTQVRGAQHAHTGVVWLSRNVRACLHRADVVRVAVGDERAAGTMVTAGNGVAGGGMDM